MFPHSFLLSVENLLHFGVAISQIFLFFLISNTSQHCNLVELSLLVVGRQISQIWFHLLYVGLQEGPKIHFDTIVVDSFDLAQLQIYIFVLVETVLQVNIEQIDVCLIGDDTEK